MSKELQGFEFSLAQCEEDLVAFRTLLDGNAELSETGEILPFFRGHPHLSAFIGSLNGQLIRIDRIGFEFDLFGDFRCDLAVGDSQRRAYTLIEFEDARATSVFSQGPKYHEEWSRRFEHGFSQLVDWFWALDDNRDRSGFRRRFGQRPIHFLGILVVGRRRFLTPQQIERLDWRLQNVPIHNREVHCLTFDDLYDALAERALFTREIASREPKT